MNYWFVCLFFGVGQGVLLTIRPGGGGRHADGPADETSPRFRLRHLRERRCRGNWTLPPLRNLSTANG